MPIRIVSRDSKVPSKDFVESGRAVAPTSFTFSREPGGTMKRAGGRNRRGTRERSQTTRAICNEEADKDNLYSGALSISTKYSSYSCSDSKLALKRFRFCRQTDGTSLRQTPRSLSRTPVTPETPDSVDAGIHEISSDNEEELKRKPRASSPWGVQEHSTKKTRLTNARVTRTNAVDPPRTPDSTDMMVDHLETLDSIENGYARREEATASPHSYLSMPSCKQFPSMRSVEPLCRVLEPVMVRHLDIDSPESARRDNGHAGSYRGDKVEDTFLARSASAIKDPGVIGPIVWNLRRHGMSAEGTGTSETDVDAGYVAPAGPVGRARRRLNELLEDSFSLFGSRDPKYNDPPTAERPSSAARTPDALAILSEPRGRSVHVSPVASPTTEMKSRPRTSLPRRGFEEEIAETGHSGPAQPRGAWGSRPLSAGPFHRPNLPEVDTRRILADCQLPPEDPAIPLIVSIKKELEKFTPP